MNTKAWMHHSCKHKTPNSNSSNKLENKIWPSKATPLWSPTLSLLFLFLFFSESLLFFSTLFPLFSPMHLFYITHLILTLSSNSLYLFSYTKQKKRTKNMKFSRELEAQLVHEWRDGYVDYKRLKKIIKNIKVSLLGSCPKSSSESQSLLYGFSVADPIRAIATRFSSRSNSQNNLQVLYNKGLQ